VRWYFLLAICLIVGLIFVRQVPLSGAPVPLVVRLSDQGSGGALAAGIVTITTTSASARRITTVTYRANGGGVVSIVVPAGRVRIVAWANGYSPVQLEPDISRSITKVPLQRSGDIAGTLVDENGAPVFGSVRLKPIDRGGSPFVLNTHTDAAGQFLIRNVATNTRYDAWVNPDSCPYVHSGQISLSPGERRSDVILRTIACSP
jgi:hypothetical protein